MAPCGAAARHNAERPRRLSVGVVQREGQEGQSMLVSSASRSMKSLSRPAGTFS
jgi:hypothetical protein